MKQRYDLIVALGGDRSCAEAIGLAGLRFLPFPFDDIEGVTLAERLETVLCKPTDDVVARLDRHVAASRTVLLVWADVPKGVTATDAECRRALETFATRWPDATFGLMAFRQKDGARLGDYEVAEAGFLRTVAFDYRHPAAAGCDPRLLAGWLRKEYAVADYRTPEEREACARERRERAARNLKAMGSVARLVTEIQLAVFAALKGHLLRLGVIEE